MTLVRSPLKISESTRTEVTCGVKSRAKDSFRVDVLIGPSIAPFQSLSKNYCFTLQSNLSPFNRSSFQSRRVVIVPATWYVPNCASSN
jgi:hypothetical protein